MLSAFTSRLTNDAGNAITANLTTVMTPVGRNTHRSPLLSLREAL
jgi:hypothetical protein